MYRQQTWVKVMVVGVWLVWEEGRGRGGVGVGCVGVGGVCVGEAGRVRGEEERERMGN